MALQELIQSWQTRRSCKRCQLESLIGHLHHAAKVVWPGRTFLRRMLDLLCCFHTRDHTIRLSSDFRLDLQWWHDFLTSWHGVSLWLFPGMSAPTDVEVTSDAVGFLGFGAYCNITPCPTEEWTLCLFATFLANTVQHSTIKVYLSAVRSLHIEQGFTDPLVDCLCLQRVLRGIKRTQGDTSSLRPLVTDDNIMMVIFHALDLSLPDHCMFWVACNLAYFGFLCSVEFTVLNPASFSPSIHLGLADVAVDSMSSPSCLWLCIKASKTDPFRKGCFLHIGRGEFPL